ncbi:MAG: SDR family NAD(P)-dependent oxidoreductase [Bacteroidetes bacterium]|jgi:short-subunit dehydrogenase|nr:SDR family NAD(P)-dependent oxidoreductase [Bacteroidota bacterium]
MESTALITGASSGIGMELARIFAREGHNLLLTARREERLKELKETLEAEFEIEAAIFPCDLSEPEAPQALFDFCDKNKFAINTLVNNAGIGDFGPFTESDWNKQAVMIDLNMRALTHLTHLFLPMLIHQKRAFIMNVASTAAFQPGPLMSVYYATKHYVLAFGEAIAEELKKTGVSVTTLCPGPTKSEFQKTAGMEKSGLFKKFAVATSGEVAEYGYRAMMNGKRIAVYGVLNKISAASVQLLPSRLVTPMVKRIQSAE